MKKIDSKLCIKQITENKMNADDYKKLLAENNEKGFEDPDIIRKMNSMTPEEIDIFCIYEYGVPGANKNERQIVDLWYQEWEKLNGDGYYLDPTKDAGLDKMAVHVFYKESSYWIQMSGDTISGLDGDSGSRLLGVLNMDGQHGCVGIKNLYQTVLYSVGNLNP
jgi:hypothetical protein